jgi:hypothetical protein
LQPGNQGTSKNFFDIASYSFSSRCHRVKKLAYLAGKLPETFENTSSSSKSTAQKTKPRVVNAGLCLRG